MIQTAITTIHPSFKLNGQHFNQKELCSLAKTYLEQDDIFNKHIGTFLLAWFDDKTYIEITTSGTTGPPKVIQLQKNAMKQSALATGAFFALKPGDKALNCMSVQFIAGKMMLVRSLILGLELDTVSPSSSPLAHNTTYYDFVAMVPLQLQNSILDLKYIKKLIIGGAKMDKALEEKVAAVETEIYETYGMTETITHIAARRTGEEVFTLLPHVSITQDDRDCLTINIPLISKELIITNDIVMLKNDKQFVFLGRADNVINSGGIKLIPEQIEAKLVSKIPARYFVIGIPDTSLGEKLILAIEGEERKFPTDFFDGLTKYEKPKEIIFIKKFKETESGKVLRKASLNL